MLAQLVVWSRLLGIAYFFLAFSISPEQPGTHTSQLLRTSVLAEARCTSAACLLLETKLENMLIAYSEMARGASIETEKRVYHYYPTMAQSHS